MNFLVLAPNPWHGLWRNRQQIFSRLAARHRVLYVEPQRASLADWRRGRVRWDDLRRPALVQALPNLWLYRVPAWLPTRGTGDAFDRATDALLAAHLRRVLRELSMFNDQRLMANDQRSMVNGQRPRGDDSRGLGHRRSTVDHWQLAIDHWPLLWLYRPTHWRWAADHLPHSRLIYHVTDDYTAFTHLSPAERQAMAAAERELLAAADLTIVTAARLLALKAPYARRIELVPNGVDFAAFQAALAEPGSLPAVDAIPRPRLLYSGHISARLDLPLLTELARARPSWHLVFAGSEDPRGCAEELAQLKALPNVHFLGVLPVAQVPRLVAACDVGLVPYRVNDETRAISSLKLYEYLAAGKPAVSAAVPAAEEHADAVAIAEATPAAWTAAVEAALATAADPARVAARQAIAAANTWEERVRRIEELVES
ncbi:MAG: glycosyltransferase, partial [Caldilineales bacterium]|nr:glycosyltransferase [Caldilineales bacterium]